MYVPGWVWLVAALVLAPGLLFGLVRWAGLLSVVLAGRLVVSVVLPLVGVAATIGIYAVAYSLAHAGGDAAEEFGGIAGRFVFLAALFTVAFGWEPLWKHLRRKPKPLPQENWTPGGATGWLAGRPDQPTERHEGPGVGPGRPSSRP